MPWLEVNYNGNPAAGERWYADVAAALSGDSNDGSP